MKNLNSILLLSFLIVSISVFAQTNKEQNAQSLNPIVKTIKTTQKKVKKVTKSSAKKGDALRVNARKKSIGEWLENKKTKAIIE